MANSMTEDHTSASRDALTTAITSFISSMHTCKKCGICFQNRKTIYQGKVALCRKCRRKEREEVVVVRLLAVASCDRRARPSDATRFSVANSVATRFSVSELQSKESSPSIYEIPLEPVESRPLGAPSVEPCPLGDAIRRATEGITTHTHTSYTQYVIPRDYVVDNLIQALQERVVDKRLFADLYKDYVGKYNLLHQKVINMYTF